MIAWASLVDSNAGDEVLNALTFSDILREPFLDNTISVPTGYKRGSPLESEDLLRMRIFSRTLGATAILTASLLAVPVLAFAAPAASSSLHLLGPSGDIPVGASASWTATTSITGTVHYQFWTESAQGVRHIIEPYSSTNQVTWTVPKGSSELGVTVKSTTNTEWTVRTINGIQPTSASPLVVSLHSSIRLSQPGLGRFWLENPAAEWLTLGAYSSQPTSWTPLFPGTYHMVSMTKAPGASDVNAHAVERTVEVVPKSHALVALGDSISFGWDLGNNWNPSPDAFPFLMGKVEKLPVDDLGYPGWTTANLLHALPTKLYTSTLATASVVTIDIGNNDLLQPAAKDGLLGANPPSSLSSSALDGLEAATKTIGSNLALILSDVQHEAPNARIIVYNLYDPMASNKSLVGAAASSLVGMADGLIAKDAAAANVTLVNAYAAFQGHQSAYVQAANFHPTLAGQAVLAKIGEQALASAP